MASEPLSTRTRGLSRRAALKALGTSAGAVALLPWLSNEGVLAFTRLQQTGAPPNPLVLSTAQFATVEALVEAIIPADERSPGARDARVADFIDLLLSESDDEVRTAWFEGLEALDIEARGRFGSRFAELTDEDMDVVLAAISRYEREPITPLEFFFVTAKQAAITGFYTSEIGIHKELRYKGNQLLPEFVGCHTEDGQDCPHCGQKAKT